MQVILYVLAAIGLFVVCCSAYVAVEVALDNMRIRKRKFVTDLIESHCKCAGQRKKGKQK